MRLRVTAERNSLGLRSFLGLKEIFTLGESVVESQRCVHFFSWTVAGAPSATDVAEKMVDVGNWRRVAVHLRSLVFVQSSI